MHYNLVKASNRRYLEELKNRGHEMKPVYDAVNIMQETEWVINKPIYEVILKLIEETNSSSIRDMGNIMGTLKSKYAGQLDFALAGKLLKEHFFISLTLQWNQF